LDQYKKLLRQRRQMKKQADEIAAATAAAAGDAEAEAHAKAGLARELYWVEQPDKVGMIICEHYARVIAQRPSCARGQPPGGRRLSAPPPSAHKLTRGAGGNGPTPPH